MSSFNTAPDPEKVAELLDSPTLLTMYGTLRRAYLDDGPEHHGAAYFLAGIMGDKDRFLRIAFDAFKHFASRDGVEQAAGPNIRAALRQLITDDDEVDVLS